MTSVRTCYCKHEGNVARKKDNDIRIHNGNRHPATAAVSKKSIVTNATCEGGRESWKRARCVTNAGTLNTNRSVEAQPSNPVLSPETSTALENAEKIINNAKRQLMEVCVTSSFDSARRNRNTYSDEPPLDDEMEERLYVRELVASRFHNVCSSGLSVANGKATARSEKRDFPHVTVRKVDLSAPKFRVSRRQRANWWSSLGYGSSDQSRERASPARVSSPDSIDVVDEAPARDDRARERRRRTLSARGDACEIQVGPSVHIVDRELTRQDLEDVHISPESSRAQSCANTATYTLRHDAIRNADGGTNEAQEVSGAPRTRRVRLDTLQREKPTGRSITEAAAEAIRMTSAGKLEKDLEDVKSPDSARNDGRISSSKVRNYRQERKDRESDPQDTGRTSESLKNASRGAIKFAVIETPRTDRDEKLENNARNENHGGIAPGGDTKIRHAEDDEIFCKRISGAGRPRNNESTADKIQATENRGEPSKSSPGGDTSRRAGCNPRRENTASRCREAESPRPYRTTDRHFSHTFNSHNGQDGLRDVAGVSLASGCTDDVFRETTFAEDDSDEIDLYRPRLDDLDSILHSNDRKIERVARTARNLSELLSGPEFTIYKLDEDVRAPQDREKLGRDSADKNREHPFASSDLAQSSVLEIELRNEDLTISEARRTDEDSRGTNAAAGTSAKSSTFTRENDSRGDYNSVESSVFPASDASDGPTRASRDSDKAQQQSAAKARSSDSSLDRLDVTTFSNLAPALSSTRTETQACRYRDEKVAQGDRHPAKSRVTSASKFPKREIRRSGTEYADDGIFARLFRKDADPFVACLLQDEKRSVEGKVALTESTVAPAAIQKLLNHLREAESIRDARQTEDTLDILRNILINVKSQSVQGNAHDKDASPRDIPDPSARTNAPPSAIDGFTSRGENAPAQTPAKIDASEIERVAKSSCELKGLGERSTDFSECREARESARSTARCESTRHPENNSRRDTGRTEGADVARTVPIENVKSQADRDASEINPKKEGTLPRNVTGSLIRTNATSSDAIGETTLRAKNNTSDTGRVAGESNDFENPDKYFSPAIPEAGESVRSAARFEAARGSENNSKGNSCSEAESLKHISDIRSDEDENPGENPEHLSAKVASAGSREGREMEAADSVVAIAVADNQMDDVNTDRFGESKSNDVQANKDQHANKIVAADRAIDARSDIPEEAAKGIASEKTRDGTTPADKRVLFALSEVSEMKSELARPDASPVGSKAIDGSPTKTDVDLVHPAAKEDTVSLRRAKTDPQQAAIKEISPADNGPSVEPPRDCVLPSAKSGESSLREIASRSKQISFDIAGKDDSTRSTGNEGIRKSLAARTVENRNDGNGISESERAETRGDNERQPIDLTEARRYKIDVLSSSNSSVSSMLLDHDRSINGVSSANARRIGTTTPETSHSEGELYMPSSCSYSLGEVRVLRGKRDLIEDNAMDRDSSVTVLVTRSMLTSLNDSTVSLLESSGRV
ncbi:PREDICTED: uncharacterized protein LOC105451115 [Wasmannia auropunctata]|uniref:uncharacterized protein LOC105451115 n=1 Tax=Wasmannia auropunctata TaxID=64793 RepID=UPI0005EE480D|nr:PREDICTED: uncharacterized protein LOC105451115 [Wasmannia auropunctata]